MKLRSLLWTTFNIATIGVYGALVVNHVASIKTGEVTPPYQHRFVQDEVLIEARTIALEASKPEAIIVEMPLPPARPRHLGIVPDHLVNAFNEAAAKEGLEPALLAAVAKQESRFRPTVCSHAGACGLMQFMPGTARQYRVDRFDEVSSIFGAARYLSYLHDLFGGNTGLALAAYNWGEGNLGRWLDRGANENKMPSETRNYVFEITGMPISVWTGAATMDGLVSLASSDREDHLSVMRRAFGS